MEPVEIDIRMRQNVAEESKKASKSLDSMGAKSRKAQQEIRENIAIQKSVLQELRKELSALEADFKKVNFGSNDAKVNAEKQKLSKAVRNLRAEINLEEKALQELEKRQQSYTNKTQNLETEIRKVRNEMAALKLQGKANTQEYKVLEERLGLLGTAYRELSATQKALSTGGTQLAGILSGLNAVSGAFAATAGAMGMVTGSSEDMAKVQTRLQSLMAITIGLQQVSNTLHETSAFRITTVAKVKQLWAAANIRVATTLGITNLQAQLLVGTLTLGLSVAIGAVAVLIDRYISKQKAAAEETKKFNEAVASSAADILTNFEKLRREYEGLGDSLKDKEKFILDNQKAFDRLGVSINDVNDADNLLIKQTEAYKQAILERAKATAYMEQATEKYKKVIELQLQADKLPDTLVKEYRTHYVSSFGTTIGSTTETETTANSHKLALQAEIKKQIKDIEKLRDKQIEAEINAENKLKKASIATQNTLAKHTKSYWENQKKEAEKAISLMEYSEKGTAKWNEQLAKLKEAQEKLKAWDLSSKSTKTGSNKKKALRELAKLDADIEREINANALAIMKEGKDKKIAQLDEEHRQRKERILKKKEELIQLEKQLGITNPERHKQIDALLTSEDKRYAQGVENVNAAFTKEANKEWEKLLKDYQTYEDKKAEILAHYAEQRKKIEEKNQDGKYDENLKEVDKAEAKALFQLSKEAGAIKSTIAEIFSDLSGKSTAQLREILGKAKEMFAFLKSGEYNIEKGTKFGIDEETFKSISQDPAVLKAINDLIKRLTNNTKTFGEHFKTLFKKDTNTEAFEQSFSKVNSKIQAGIGLTQMFASTLKNIADISGSGALGDIADSLSSIADVAGGAMQGAQAGMAFGPVGAGIGAGLGLVSSIAGKIGESNRRHREALLAIQKSEIAQQRIYNKLLWEQKLLMKDKESIFGVDALSKALGYMTAYNESFANLQDKLKKKHGVTEYFGGLLKVPNFQSELDKIQVKTGHKKTGLFGWGKGRDLYSSITQIPEYEKLIDKQGNFNRELAQSILQTREFREGGKEALQEIIDQYDQMQEAQQRFDEYMRDTFGELGNSIVDSVVDALKSGEDAFESFAKSVGNIMGKLGKQLMYEIFVSSHLKELQGKIKNIYKAGGSPEQTAKQVRQAIGDFAQVMKNEQKAMQAFAEGWREDTKELGFDVYSNEDGKRAVASKGLAQASQDSIDDVLGRLYALVRFVNEIKEIDTNFNVLQKESITIQSAMLSQLETIAANTEYNKLLKDIMDDIRDIRERGIKVKM